MPETSRLHVSDSAFHWNSLRRGLNQSVNLYRRGSPDNCVVFCTGWGAAGRGAAGRGGAGRGAAGRGGLRAMIWQHLRCGLTAGQVTAGRGGLRVRK